MEREEIDAILDARSDTAYKKPKTDIKRELKHMAKALVIFSILAVIGSAIIIGLLLLFGLSMDQIAGHIISVSVVLIVLTFLYLFLGFKAGSAIFMTNMWRSAWTNKKVDKKFAYSEFRQFISLGNISIFLLILSLSNFIYFYFFY